MRWGGEGGGETCGGRQKGIERENTWEKNDDEEEWNKGGRRRREGGEGERDVGEETKGRKGELEEEETEKVMRDERGKEATECIWHKKSYTCYM